MRTFVIPNNLRVSNKDLQGLTGATRTGTLTYLDYSGLATYPRTGLAQKVMFVFAWQEMLRRSTMFIAGYQYDFSAPAVRKVCNDSTYFRY